MGTVTFSAQDPDDALTHTLVSGVGDGNNSMFTINGEYRDAEDCGKF